MLWLDWIWGIIALNKEIEVEEKQNEWAHNNIGDEGAARICESLLANTSLAILYLSSDEQKNKGKKIHTDKRNEQGTILVKKEQWR